ncbi:glycosyltransferase [Arthrobacter sp. RHLT1-20]
MQPSGLRIRLVVPGNVRHNSGGNVYNAALARELSALDSAVETCPLDGDWPVGSAADRRRLGALLTAGAGGEVTVVDGLLACGAPEELAAAAAAGRPAWILLHMPLEDAGHDETGLERRALRAAAGVICTSGAAAAGIRARHGMDGVRVALPGSGPAPLAAGSVPPHLIAVAALLPNKDQSLLIAALSALTELPWTASLVGSDSADPGYAARLRDTVQRLGLQDRIRIPGELRGEALEVERAAADLSLLISRAETYGLVVTESIARGVPAVVRTGTGAVEALAAGARPGATTLPGTAVALDTDPAPLAEILRRWLTEPALRSRWRAAAVAARERLPGWDATARTVLAALVSAPDTGRPAATPHEKTAADDSPAAQAVGQ